MGKDKLIEEIASKLQNHASDVNPQMWSAISSQIGAGAAGASATGAAFGAGKVAAIVIGVAAVSVASYFAVSSSKTEDVQQTATVEQTKPTTTTTQEMYVADSKNTETTKNSIAIPEDKKVSTETKGSKRPEVKAEKAVANESNTIEIKIPMVTEPIRTIEGSKSTINKREISQDKVNASNNGASMDKATAKASYAITNLPNTFTPNGDGTNDYFSVTSSGLTNYSLVVLDKSNKRIWQTTDPNAKWDGIGMDGEKVPNGEYIYFVAADGPNGEKVAKYQKLIIQ